MTIITETREKHSGKVLFENQSTLFIRGAGGFGGRRTGKGFSSFLLFVYDKLFQVSSTDRGAASAVNEPPSRKPDAVLEEQTSTSQAALYR